LLSSSDRLHLSSFVHLLPFAQHNGLVDFQQKSINSITPVIEALTEMLDMNNVAANASLSSSSTTPLQKTQSECEILENIIAQNKQALDDNKQNASSSESHLPQNSQQKKPENNKNKNTIKNSIDDIDDNFSNLESNGDSGGIRLLLDRNQLQNKDVIELAQFLRNHPQLQINEIWLFKNFNLDYGCALAIADMIIHQPHLSQIHLSHTKFTVRGARILFDAARDAGCGITGQREPVYIRLNETLIDSDSLELLFGNQQNMKMDKKFPRNEIDINEHTIEIIRSPIATSNKINDDDDNDDDDDLFLSPLGLPRISYLGKIYESFISSPNSHSKKNEKKKKDLTTPFLPLQTLSPMSPDNTTIVNSNSNNHNATLSSAHVVLSPLTKVHYRDRRQHSSNSHHHTAKRAVSGNQEKSFNKAAGSPQRSSSYSSSSSPLTTKMQTPPPNQKAKMISQFEPPLSNCHSSSKYTTKNSKLEINNDDLCDVHTSPTLGISKNGRKQRRKFKKNKSLNDQIPTLDSTNTCSPDSIRRGLNNNRIQKKTK